MFQPSLVRAPFCREAMATTFSIRVVHEEPCYARQATVAAFEELDRLETQLSRFVQGSDVWRINRLARGEAAVVALDTFRCLAAAEEIRTRTRGAFDVTYASAPNSKPSQRLELNPAGCVVRALTEGMRVDFGGIGKGYALDVMADVLRDWDITVALLAASTSTILGLDPPPNEPGWSVALGCDRQVRRLELSHEALSGSGIAVKGNHIVDPRTHQPAQQRLRTWARAPSATKADALSTAFMVMSCDEVQKYCCGDRGTRAYLLGGLGEPVRAFPE